MSQEERALRNADAFFSDESKWHRGHLACGDNGSRCVGQAIIDGDVGAGRFGGWTLADRACRAKNMFGFLIRAAQWNVRCRDFATMKAHLKKRIEYYEDVRMKVT